MKQQILFIHGGEPAENFGSFAAMLLEKGYTLDKLKEKRWRHFLEERLGDGYEVFLPDMPNKNYAKYDEWKIVFEKLLDSAGDNLIMIGHSLGGTFLCKYLLEKDEKLSKKAKALFLVAPAYFDNTEVMGSFKIEGLDLQEIENKISDIFIYHSKDDFLVPFSDLEVFKEKIPSIKSREFEKYGHFLTEEFPEIEEDIKCL